MTTLSGESHLPSPNFKDFPFHPYACELIQISALQSLGYPVGLEMVSRDEALPRTGPYGLDFTDEVGRWEYDTYPRWGRPVIHNPAFRQYVLDPRDICGMESDDEELDEAIQTHPVQLVSKVDEADIGGIWLAKKFFLSHGHDREWPGLGGVMDVQAIAGKAFVAAVERRISLISLGHPTIEMEDLSTGSAIYYSKLKSEGVTAIDPEQLGGLVVNFYEMVERGMPRFAAFKHQTNN